MHIGIIGCDPGVSIAVDALVRLPFVQRVIVLDQRPVTEYDVMTGAFPRQSIGKRRDKVMQTVTTVRTGETRVECATTARDNSSRIQRLLATADPIIVGPTFEPTMLPVIENLRAKGTTILHLLRTRSEVRITRRDEQRAVPPVQEHDPIGELAALGDALGIIEAIRRRSNRRDDLDITVPIPDVIGDARSLGTRTARERIVICGVGALGSHIADRLIRLTPESLTIVDHDVVEDRNRGNQGYGVNDIGRRKVEALVSRWRDEGFFAHVVPLHRTVDDSVANDLVANATLVLDCFDNRRARAAVTNACTDHAVACLHLGMAEGFCDVAWNDRYHVPDDVPAPDPCGEPFTHSLALFTTMLGYASIIQHLTARVWQDMWGTMSDFTIHMHPRRPVVLNRVVPNPRRVIPLQ